MIKGDTRELDPRWMALEGSWSETQLSMGVRSCNNWWGPLGAWGRVIVACCLTDLMQLFETGGVVGREEGRWVWWPGAWVGLGSKHYGLQVGSLTH